MFCHTIIIKLHTYFQYFLKTYHPAIYHLCLRLSKIFSCRHVTYHTLWFCSIRSIAIVPVRTWGPRQFWLETLKHKIFKTGIYFQFPLNGENYTNYVFDQCWQKNINTTDILRFNVVFCNHHHVYITTDTYTDFMFLFMRMKFHIV